MYSKKILFTLMVGTALINFSKEALCGHRKPVFELSETPLGKTPATPRRSASLSSSKEKG